MVFCSKCGWIYEEPYPANCACGAPLLRAPHANYRRHDRSTIEMRSPFIGNAADPTANSLTIPLDEDIPEWPISTKWPGVTQQPVSSDAFMWYEPTRTISIREAIAPLTRFVAQESIALAHEARELLWDVSAWISSRHDVMRRTLSQARHQATSRLRQWQTHIALRVLEWQAQSLIWREHAMRAMIVESTQTNIRVPADSMRHTLALMALVMRRWAGTGTGFAGLIALILLCLDMCVFRSLGGGPPAMARAYVACRGVALRLSPVYRYYRYYTAQRRR